MRNRELNKLNEIKVMLKIGQIDYDRATEMAQPYLDIMNKKGEKIAKKFGVRHKPIDFTNFMR